MAFEQRRDEKRPEFLQYQVGLLVQGLSDLCNESDINADS